MRMEDKNIEILQQASSEFAKEEEEIQTDKILKPNVEQPEAIAEKGSEVQTEKFQLPKIEIETADDPFDDCDEPFPVRMYPCERHFTDDSSTDSSDVSDSTSDSEAIGEEESDIQTHKSQLPKIEIETDDDPFDDWDEPFPVRMYPCKRHFSDDSPTDSSDSTSDSEAIGEEESDIQTQKSQLPKIETFDDSNEPFPIIMYPCKRHFSDDSSTDSSYFSDSDETIAEEESKINKESSPKDGEKQLEFPSNASPQDDQTPSEPLEETQAKQLAKSSTTEPISGPTVPTSSILVKHGTKHPIEAEVGDEESKRPNKLALLKSTIENVQNW
ncbi:hypothetical protein POM88_033322 [Heracleum sosnowskyi]|uniref:Uncharacterized protein n=1 Tax=Heracleum sosnowskyi TaxID=360622 RepID=A0AAD8I287_9APIA|nr:hypothetical protein POM88_033322 [Heracleum sosnowskyi]